MKIGNKLYQNAKVYVLVNEGKGCTECAFNIFDCPKAEDPHELICIDYDGNKAGTFKEVEE